MNRAKQLSIFGVPVLATPGLPKGSLMLVTPTLEIDAWHHVVAYRPDGTIVTAKCRMNGRDCEAKDVTLEEAT